jgi:hypothetical protein
MKAQSWTRVLCGFLLALALVAVTRQIRAMPCCEIDHWYYDDENFSSIYSEHLLMCDDVMWRWIEGWPGSSPTPNEATWSQNCATGEITTYCTVNGQSVTCPPDVPPPCVNCGAAHQQASRAKRLAP